VHDGREDNRKGKGKREGLMMEKSVEDPERAPSPDMLI
jgi:hypothetical protein